MIFILSFENFNFLFKYLHFLKQTEVSEWALNTDLARY